MSNGEHEANLDEFDEFDELHILALLYEKYDELDNNGLRTQNERNVYSIIYENIYSLLW